MLITRHLGIFTPEGSSILFIFCLFLSFALLHYNKMRLSIFVSLISIHEGVKNTIQGGRWGTSFYYIYSVLSSLKEWRGITITEKGCKINNRPKQGETRRRNLLAIRDILATQMYRMSFEKWKWFDFQEFLYV